MKKKDWNGTWEDSDGYWVKIEITKNSVHLSRSGNIKSKLTFQEFSNSFDSLIYEEKAVGLNFRHTLSFLKNGSIEDNWLDLKKKTVWKRKILKNKETNNLPVKINQGPASEAIFDEEKYNDLQVAFLSRLLPEIKSILEEELTNTTQGQLIDLAEKVGFSVASTLDGCDVIGDNQTSVPHLSFREDGKIITNMSGSFMHEMVSGFLIDHRD